jgi:hypothetical protein
MFARRHVMPVTGDWNAFVFESQTNGQNPGADGGIAWVSGDGGTRGPAPAPSVFRGSGGGVTVAVGDVNAASDPLDDEVLVFPPAQESSVGIIPARENAPSHYACDEGSTASSRLFVGNLKMHSEAQAEMQYKPLFAFTVFDLE